MTAHGVLAALAAAALGACLPVAPAQAAAWTPARGARTPTAPAARSSASPTIRRVCRESTPVFDTPGGIVIGILARGDRVTVLMHAANRPQWVLARGPIDIRGWIRQRALC
jgi:hypothetical protein